MDPLYQFLKKKRNYWKKRREQKWDFLCPQCRAQRTLPFHPSPSHFRHYAQIALTTVIFTLLTWDVFHLKGLVAFVPLWGIFEVFYRVRVRARLSCPECGFDPYLYLNDVTRARSEMERFWRARFESHGIPFPEKDGLVKLEGEAEAAASEEPTQDQAPQPPSAS